ncbi:MAG: prepilin-type N-terminal cleavage/methylation domain-containing protein [Elusimicrobiaceae bacterium]|nr:prepilin-type N-terminal cleavage/methylation domain-containing protein [Elusimicrobiaceae bacterium]
MITKKLGFTLIELLAVVMIIAILTSVAVPKYRRSVVRAEATEAMVNLRTLFESAKRFRAANSAAPMRLKGLDVTFREASSDTDPAFTMGNFSYEFTSQFLRACRLNNGNYCFYFYYRMEGSGADVLVCEIVDLNGKNSWLCENIGQEELGTDHRRYVVF